MVVTDFHWNINIIYICDQQKVNRNVNDDGCAKIRRMLCTTHLCVAKVSVECDASHDIKVRSASIIIS